MNSSSKKRLLNKISSLFVIREKQRYSTLILLGAIPILILCFTWWFLTKGAAEDRLISILILPSPVEVFSSFKSLWFEAELSRAIVYSLSRVISGFFLAIVIAFPLSLMIGAFSKVKAMFDPIVLFIGYLPIPALVPLTMSLFGIGELQKVLFLALAFFIYLLPLFVESVEKVDNIYLHTAYTLGATKIDIVKKILLPISLPGIIQAMRLGFGIGWTYIILAEMVAADRGLGQIIIIAQRRGPREHIYLVLIVIVLIAWLTDKMWVSLAKKLFPYQVNK